MQILLNLIKILAINRASIAAGVGNRASRAATLTMRRRREAGATCARRRARARTGAARQWRKLSDGVYRPADALFEKVRMLQPGELDREALLEVAHHPALHVLPRVTSVPIAGRWSVAIAAPDSDRSMMRQVRLTPFGRIRWVDRLARHDAAVAAVFRQVEDVAVGEPGELGGELVALARRRRDRHGEAVLEDARAIVPSSRPR